MDMYEAHLDIPVRRAFLLAVEGAKTSGLNCLGTCGLVRELLRQDPEFFAAIFRELGIEQEKFCERLIAHDCARKHFAAGGVHISSEVRHAFSTALGRARAHGREIVTMADMVTVLAGWLEGPFRAVLVQMGAAPDAIAPAVMRFVKQREGENDASPRQETEAPYRTGEMVRIIHGAFAPMPARIEGVHQDRSQVKLRVKLFGKSEVVTLPFSDIAKIRFG
jgi:ATP-dependent Clp protease ATP-binding subunit ClpA